MTRSNALIRGLERTVMTFVSGALGLRARNRPQRTEPLGAQRVLICKWCCLGDAIVSLYAVREFKRRNPDIVIDMLVETMALLPEFRLRIIGDGPERWNLAELAHDLGLEGRVDFRGHIDNGRLEDGLEGASLLVMPTGENARQAEQFGKAAIEGVSCGLPVLASRTGNLAALARVFPTLAARDLD